MFTLRDTLLKTVLALSKQILKQDMKLSHLMNDQTVLQKDRFDHNLKIHDVLLMKYRLMDILVTVEGLLDDICDCKALDL